MKYKYIQSNRLIVRGGKDGQEINKKDKKRIRYSIYKSLVVSRVTKFSADVPV